MGSPSDCDSLPRGEFKGDVNRLGERMTRIVGSVRRLDEEFVRANARIDRFESRLSAKLDEGFTQVLGAIDRCADRLEGCRRAAIKAESL